MSESTILTAETYKSGQEKEDSPDVKQDENLETEKDSEESSDKAEESTSNEAETSNNDDKASQDADSQAETDDEEESPDLAKQAEKGELPEWQNKRFLRALKKHERNMRQIEDEARQRHQLPPTQQPTPQQYDPNTQLQDPYTGEIVDINSVQGQTLLQLAKVAQAQAQYEEQQKINKERGELKQKLDKGYDKFDDFEEVVRDSGIAAKFTDAMTNAVAKAANPDEFVYNLAKYKPEEIDRISKLSPTEQIWEMATLANQMQQSAKKKIVKKVPEPPSKIKGSGSSMKDDSDLSFEDLKKRRRNEERKALGLPPV